MEAACSAVGLDPSTADVARLTQTGGLPYHGGPGSNYSCHGLCAVVERLRTDLYRGEMGVVGANGGILTEHSVGVYSTTPPDQVIPTPSHVLDRISPIFPPFFPVFCAVSPSRRGGSNEPQAGAQGQETVARAPKHRFAGPANSGCSERMVHGDLII